MHLVALQYWILPNNK